MSYQVCFYRNLGNSQGRLRGQPLGMVPIQGAADRDAAIDAATCAFAISKRIARSGAREIAYFPFLIGRQDLRDDVFGQDRWDAFVQRNEPGGLDGHSAHSTDRTSGRNTVR